MHLECRLQNSNHFVQTLDMVNLERESGTLLIIKNVFPAMGILITAKSLI